MESRAHHPCGVKKGPDAGYGVRAIVESRAKRGGERWHVVRGQRLVIWTKAPLEDIQGIDYIVPFTFGFLGCSFEGLVLLRGAVAIAHLVWLLLESRRETHMTSGWHHTIHLT